MSGASNTLKREKKVLVVDDDQLVRSSILDALASGGFETLEAENGRDCLRILEKEKVDAVVLDIIMPEMEGLEVIMALRKTHPGIKILAISGGGRIHNADILKAADKLGANAVLNKPFDPDQLIRQLRSLTGLAVPSNAFNLFPDKGAFAR